ncbi:MAG TPA: hypothetical protein VHX65_16075 [Pirellulales bacterium]|jgi:hypothetical protein|nr:hypothetical protein [Pirellulales bacterium]
MQPYITACDVQIQRGVILATLVVAEPARSAQPPAQSSESRHELASRCFSETGALRQPMIDRKPPAQQWLEIVVRAQSNLAFAMADFRPHAALLATQLAPPLASFLYSHAVLLSRFSGLGNASFPRSPSPSRPEKSHDTTPAAPGKSERYPLTIGDGD